MRYRLVAFDLDGTLLDTLEDLADAVNATMRQFNLPTLTIEEVRSFVGDGIRLLLTRCANPYPFDEKMGAFMGETYAKHCQDKTKPYDGIMPLLAALQEKGVQMAVLSNKPDFATKKLVELYFGDYIRVAVGENEKAGVRKKPAPDALFAVMEQFGVAAKDTLYVGDSEVDIKTAKAAGVDCVSVLWGFKDRQFLQDNGGATMIEKPAELLDIL